MMSNWLGLPYPPDGTCVATPTVNPWVVSVPTIITSYYNHITVVLLIVYAKGKGGHATSRSIKILELGKYREDNGDKT